MSDKNDNCMFEMEDNVNELRVAHQLRFRRLYRKWCCQSRRAMTNRLGSIATEYNF